MLAPPSRYKLSSMNHCRCKPLPPLPPPVNPAKPCNCPPRVYRNPPDVILDAGDNIKLDKTEGDQQVTYKISAVIPDKEPVKVDPEIMYGDGVNTPLGVYDYDGDKPGLVPQAPPVGPKPKYLADDGTWKTIDIPVQQQADWASEDVHSSSYIKNKPRVDVYVGPSEQTAAIPGFVPGATNEETGKFLRGDGTWATAITEVEQELDSTSEKAVSGKAVAAALDGLDEKVTTLFNSIQAVPVADASDIVTLEPGDSEDPLDFDTPE